jgi:serine/threonine protein kinase
VWKRLKHKNIVPLLGITPTPLQLISDWMPGGDLTEHIRNYPNADRLDLVGVPPVMLGLTLTLATSYLMSLTAFASSTPAASFTVILREYVIALSPDLPPY